MKLKKLLFFLFFFIFLNLINSQTVDDDIISITDITYPSSITEKYPTIGPCYYYFTFKVEFGENCVSPFFNVTGEGAGILKRIYSENNKTSIIRAFVTDNKNDVYTNITAVATCLSGSKELSIPHICYSLNESDVKFNLLNKRIVLHDLGFYSFFFQIDGLKCPLDYIFFKEYAYPYSLHKNGFTQFFVSYKMFKENPNNQTFYLTMVFPKFNYTFSIESYYYGDVDYEITDFNTLPKYVLNYNSLTLTNLTWDLSTQSNFPSVRFKSPTKRKYPNFYIYNSIDSNGVNYPVLIDNNNDGSFNYMMVILPSSTSFKKQSEFINTTFYSLQNSNIKPFYNFQINVNFLNLNFSSNNLNIIAPTVNDNIATISFVSNLNYFNEFQWNIYSKDEVDVKFPYGFSKGSLYNFIYKASFLTPKKSRSSTFTVITNQKQSLTSVVFGIPMITTTENIIPVLLNYSFENIKNGLYSFKFEFKSNSGLDGIEIKTTFIGIEQYLISGDIYNGVVEIIIDSMDMPSSLTLYDIVGNKFSFSNDDIFATNNGYQFNFPKEFGEILNINQIYNISYLFNNVQVSNNSVSNRLTFNSSIDFKGTAIQIHFIDFLTSYVSRQALDGSSGIAEWDEEIKLYKFDFITDSHSRQGLHGFTLMAAGSGITSRFFPDSYQLNVISNYTDLYGPVFKSITKSAPVYANSTTTNNGEIKSLSLYWIIEIADSINGFKEGYIVVRGSVDGSIYNFTINPTMVISGDQFYGLYKIQIDIELPSIPQSYVITNVRLADSNGYQTFIDPIPTAVGELIFNPFINIDNPLIYKSIGFDGEVPYIIQDNTPPVLTNFTVNKTTIDVGANTTSESSLLFEFSAVDNESGLKSNQYPIIYLETGRFELLQCRSKIVKKIVNETFYNCEITLPYAFGLSFSRNNIILLSVYGFINNGGSFSGFTSDDLKSFGFQDQLTVTFTNLRPVVLNTDKISNAGGNLLIIGSCLLNSVFATIKYSDGQLNQIIQIKNQSSNVFVKLNGINSTLLPFTVTITSSNALVSNEYQITPIIYDFLIPPTIAPVTPTPTPTSTLTSTPTPTESVKPEPFKCQGNPECGGPNQGYCELNIKSCVCYPPYIGTICDGKVIINPNPPQTNESNPSVIIDTNGGGDGSKETSELVYKSIISIVSLRELDYNLNQVGLYTFDKWIYTNLSKFKNQYQTTITTKNPSAPDNENQINVTVILEWFENQTTIEFAGQNLTMAQSSLKYTIELSKYPFLSKLNSLQLIMSASLQVDKNDNICSNKVFGDTLDNNDLGSNNNQNDSLNYIQIQIEDHSLYGRFIKRGLIDSDIKTIQNQILDSSLNAISSSSSSQSFIGITIPFYIESAIIDPDFSVLVNSNPVTSSSDGSICSKSNDGLSKPQLIGIIIGSVAFAAVAIIIISYFIIKKYKDKKFIDSINLKLSKSKEN